MPSKLKRRLAWLSGSLISLLILVAIVIALSPSITRWYITRWLEQRGVTSSIEEIEFNLLDGQFLLKGFRVSGPHKHKINLSDLFVQLHLRDLLDNKLTIEKLTFANLYMDIYQQQDKPLQIGGLRLAEPQATQSEDNKTNDDAEPWEIVVDDIEFKNIKTCAQLHNRQGRPVYNNCLTLGNFRWDGNTRYRTDGKVEDPAANLDIKLSFTLKDLRLHDNNDNSDVLSIDTLHIAGLAVQGLDDIRLASLKLHNYRIFERTQTHTKDATHIATVDHITLNGLDIKKLNHITIADVNIDGLRTWLSRNQQGDFEPAVKIKQLLFAQTTAEPASAASIKPAESASSPPAVINIKNLTLAGDAKISVEDAAVNPTFNAEISKINLQLSNIDSSNALNPSPLQLSFQLGKYGQVKLDGEFALFAKRPTGKLKGTIRAVNVADFSAYINDTLQQHIKSGQLDADIALSINQGQLDSQFNLVLHKLYLQESAEADANIYKKKLGVPLSTALSLLREKDDSIHLKLPVTGDVRDPNFSLKHTINKVLTDSVKTAVINYYTPFGLITLTKAVFDLTTALRFEPILFAAASTDISAASQQQLDKLATLLNERPNIKLVVCGHATLDDRFKWYPEKQEIESQAKVTELFNDEEDEELPDLNKLLPDLNNEQTARLDKLAEHRGNQVRDYLVKDKGIEATRIIMCKPRYTNDREKPRVELSL